MAEGTEGGPEGLYTIQGTDEQAFVSFASLQNPGEICVQALPAGGTHEPLNDMLAHISVLELDHLARAVARGEPFTVDALDVLLPRPGWEITTRTGDAGADYELRQTGEASTHRGSRRLLLLLVELTVRLSLAPHDGQPASRGWIQRLRDVHPELCRALGDETLFQRQCATHR